MSTTTPRTLADLVADIADAIHDEGHCDLANRYGLIEYGPALDRVALHVARWLETCEWLTLPANERAPITAQ